MNMNSEIKLLNNEKDFIFPRMGSFKHHVQPSRYSFYFGDKKYRWERCRDNIQAVSALALNKGFWFLHNKNAGQKVAAFIDRLESKLKIPTRTTFNPTELPERFIFVNMSPWWNENLIRRSFFTMAIRSGNAYSLRKLNFLACFEKDKYAKNSMTAVNLFLEGYTHCRGVVKNRYMGWDRFFCNKDELEVKKVLFRRMSKKSMTQLYAD
jgi:hypothetical protein